MKNQVRFIVALASVCAAGTALAFDPAGRIVVEFHDTASSQQATALRTLAPELRPVHRLANGAHVLRVAEGDADAAIARLAANPGVRYAVRDPLLRHTSVDDPWYEGPNQIGEWTYTHFQADLYDPRGGVDAPAAWAQGATGEGIVVAVLDTGITAHPDLDANIVEGAGYDFITDAFLSGRADDSRSPGGWDIGDWTHVAPYLDVCGPPSPSSWHGTHVTGTIAAATNNGMGIAGMAHRAKVLPMRVLGHCGGYMTDIAEAITWASGGSVEGVGENATPAEVINLSLGGMAPCEPYLQDAIDGAVARGTTVVVAAGNANRDMKAFAPANCRNVIVVGSNGLTGKRAFYSNFGAGVTVSAPGGGLYVHDKASGSSWIPGGYIWSTHNMGMEGPGAPTISGSVGTSMAAPHVAAIVAMMQGVAQTPHTPATIATLLGDTTRMFPFGVDKPIGAGVVDAGRAVEAAILGRPGLPPPMALSASQPTRHVYAKQAFSRHFSVTVPEGKTRLTVRSFGGTGDADLYVRKGLHASTGEHDAKSERPGNNGIVVIDAPVAGTYYVAVHGLKAFSGLTLQATIE